MPDSEVSTTAAKHSRLKSSIISGEQVSPNNAAELARRFGVHPTLIHQRKRTLLEGASGVFERDGREKPEIVEEQVKELDAKIGELAVANFFWSGS